MCVCVMHDSTCNYSIKFRKTNITARIEKIKNKNQTNRILLCLCTRYFLYVRGWHHQGCPLRLLLPQSTSWSHFVLTLLSSCLVSLHQIVTLPQLCHVCWLFLSDIEKERKKNFNSPHNDDSDVWFFAGARL